MRMPFLQAMPISMMQPIWLKMLMVELNRKIPSNAPVSASGTVTRITMGWMKLSNCAASTRYTTEQRERET